MFGAGYVTLTGVYLVRGTALLAERPATGLTIAFVALAVGQAVGAPLFGLLLGRTATASPAVWAFALLPAASALALPPARAALRVSR